MKIGLKMFLGFFAVILTFTLGLGITYWQLSGIKNNVNQMKETSELAMDISEVFSLHRGRILRIEDYLLFPSQKYINDYNERVNEIEVLLKKIEPKINTGEKKELFNKIVEANRIIDTTFLKQIVQNVEMGNKDFAIQINNTIISNNRFDFRESINPLIELAEKEKQKEVNEAIQTIVEAISLLFVVVAVSIIIGIIIALFMGRKITTPIKAIQKVSNRIADGDLTVEKVEVTSQDEVGQLTIAINTMIDNVKGLIQETIALSQQVAASSEELTASSNEISSGIEQASATTEEISSGATKQAEHANITMEMIHHIAEEIKQINENANILEDSSLQANSASAHGTESVNQSMKQMVAIEGKVASTSKIIEGLGEKSNTINQILAVINDIASQTNLLALNAAIEAARAGEQGRGFAVVADEVRKLAEEAERFTNQITEIIIDVQKEAEESGKAMSEVVKEVQMGTEAMKKNGEAFKEIADIIDEMNQKIKEVTSATKQINGKMENAVESVENIAGISEESSAGTEELAASMMQQNASMLEINGMAVSLSKVTEQLEEAMAKFKL